MTNASKAAALGVIGFAAYWLTRPRPLTASVTTSSTVDLDPLGLGMTDYPRQIKDFATAIARAEGFFVNGSIPDQAHNPGNLKTPTWTAPGEIEGRTLGEGIALFESDGAGWNALYRQLHLIVTGESRVYNLDMTIRDMAARWVGTNEVEAGQWARNVSLQLGVSESTKLYQALV